MKILHVLSSRISLPPEKYGGTERVIWSLAKAQMAQGHQVRFLWGNAKTVPQGTIRFQKGVPLNQQIGDWPDIVHFHRDYKESIDKPYVITEHGNASEPKEYDANTIFLSRKHAENAGGSCFVYNGLDWSEYGEPNLNQPKDYFHFLGKARHAIKNLDGTLETVERVNGKLAVLGGKRFRLGKGAYCYFNRKARFYGMVGGAKKHELICNSLGLVMPVRWHEPFGLAFTESLYLGTPVFATPYGSLPELIDQPEIGLLSTSGQELAEAMSDLSRFDRKMCHEVAKERFGADPMARGYQVCYEKVLSGQPLHNGKPSTQGGLLDLLPYNA
ncbi:glucosyl transferase [Saccharobesus litoralis]|uniref:Glucosyl transferase n=1 Tax=Saccharobesus litoralis TaxID=2172099 RepID=A0A2S0VRH1_9ALTE|nr:glycosyltransferase [Saccharobesus litoralis]AWB66799.1 glucosyl transferase [Saccharobesus litoralis]